MYSTPGPGLGMYGIMHTVIDINRYKEIVYITSDALYTSTYTNINIDYHRKSQEDRTRKASADDNIKPSSSRQECRVNSNISEMCKVKCACACKQEIMKHMSYGVQ